MHNEGTLEMHAQRKYAHATLEKIPTWITMPKICMFNIQNAHIKPSTNAWPQEKMQFQGTKCMPMTKENAH